MLNFFCSDKVSRFSVSFLLAAFIALLAGCGGGGGGATGGTTGGTTGATPAAAQIITGTVATGAPLVGVVVEIQDSTGQKFSSTATAANGTFSVTVPTGKTPPFMLRVHAPPTLTYDMYSLVVGSSSQNVNVTPITTLVMFELNGKIDPGVMYRTLSYSALSAAQVNSAETTVRNTLVGNAAVSLVPNAFKMMSDPFVASTAVPNTDLYDKALDSLGKITTLSTAGGLVLTPALGAPTVYATPAAVGQAVVAANTPTVTMTLTDTTTPFAARTSIASTSPARVTATVKNANGAPVANAIVTFTTSDIRDSFSGGANTALTDANGLAAVTLTTSNTAGGASTVTASSTVAGAAVSNSLNYAIGASTITLSTLTLPAAALSAYGTASISVNVLNTIGGVTTPYTTPMTVSFTSGCASNGKATLTPTVTTINGTATASYLDNGCNNVAPGDNITATLMNGVTATGNLAVNPPSLGSIQFVSVVTNPVTTPTMITLKGTGGAARSETARVVFRVVDGAGNPLGNALVNFSLNTALGGLSLSSTTATSDPVTGQAVTNVLAGTMSTAVRVTATTGTLSTQSDQLLVSTGVPAQDAFSTSATTHNIEGLNYDGTTTTLTARLADHFHNPVPDGTAVYFTSEGGSIVPSCTTMGGACSVVMTSQALRPTNGRVTVLARATGEEAFTDLNSNGVVDAGEMIDANGIATDMGEAYVDYNENGLRELAAEPYIDFTGDGVYTGTTLVGTSAAEIAGVFHAPVGATSTGDAKYNGVLCNAAVTPALCAAQKSIDVRSSQVIVFSGSNAAITINAGAAIALPTCVPGIGGGVGAPLSFTVTVVDANGNAMPAGTTVVFSSTNSTVPIPASYVVPDTIGCRTGSANCPASAASPTFGNIYVSARGDATYDPITTNCTNLLTAGTFTVTVTTPKGVVTVGTATISD